MKKPVLFSAMTMVMACAALLSAPAPAQTALKPNPAMTPAWQAAWSTALQAIPDLSNPPPLYAKPQVAGRAVKQFVIPALNGLAVRIRLSNRYGAEPLVIERAAIAGFVDDALGPVGTIIKEGPASPLLFNGQPSITLPPGAEADSDPLSFIVTHQQPVAIKLTLGSRQTMQAWHRVANQVNLISTQADHAAFRERTTHYAWMTQLLVPKTQAGGLTAIGDSITDGMRSTLNEHRSWPEALARRVIDQGLPPVAVLNAGISGNRLLSDSPCYGERIVSRFEHDAVLPGARAVILLAGINDINFAAMPARRGLDCDAPHTQVTADDLIAGYQRIIAIAHRHGLRLFIGTLTPAALPPQREALRLAVNRWIRSGAGFDGIIDFDAALRDPNRPAILQAAFDSGDGIHPNDAGYAAMARAVPMTLLRDISSHP